MFLLEKNGKKKLCKSTGPIKKLKEHLNEMLFTLFATPLERYGTRRSGKRKLFTILSIV